MTFSPLNWYDLHVLLLVAETGSLNGAADRLGTTQPTVNRKISELEAYFKTKLIKRSRSGSVLTERAEEILPLISKMAHASLQIEKIARYSTDAPDGVVTIAVPDLLGAEIVAPRISSFMENNPGIVIRLDCGFWQSRLEPIRADILVGYSAPTEMSAHSEIIGHTHYCWYASIDYLKRYGIPSEYEEIMSHRILWHTAQQHQREDWPEETEALAKLAKPHMRLITNSSAAFLAAMRNGAGIGALPSYMTESCPDLVPIPLSEAKDAHIYLSVDRAVANTQPVKKVVSWLRNDVLCSTHNPWLTEQFHHPFDWWSEHRPDLLSEIEVSSGLLSQSDVIRPSPITGLS